MLSALRAERNVPPAVSLAVHDLNIALRRCAVRTARPRGDLRLLADRIADVMREMAFAGQTVTRDTLALRGFTRAEMTDAVMAEALDRATQDSIRRL